MATGKRESPIKALLEFGQSPWLDYIQRRLLLDGELERMVLDWGLRGLTSNPVIFKKAITGTGDYDADIAALARDGSSAEEIAEMLAIQDVQYAADLLLPVYEATSGADGFASLEVSPRLADDADATIDEARRLWLALGRSNAMIKVPGTTEGLVAIRSLLAEGINVNVTLLFSVERYRDVLDAHLRGLEDAAAAGQDVARIASVASFFLSRIDTMVDAELDRMIAASDSRSRDAAELRGEIAVASARKAYAAFESFIESPPFRDLANRGGRPQRLLWASTGTKDPAYSDIKYVEELIGPATVNTMPLATMQAYHDHGRPELRLTGHLDDADTRLQRLGELGIDLDKVTASLLREGVDKFVKPQDSLIETLENARRSALAAPRNGAASRLERGA